MQRYMPALVASLGTLCVSELAFAADAGTSTVPNPSRWDLDASVVGGSACVKDFDAWVLVNGGDVSMVFTNLGVALHGGGPMAPLTASGACSVRLPVTIPVGAYPQAITQSFDYAGVTRSPGATGTLGTSIRFLGFAVSPLGLLFDDSDAGSPNGRPRLTFEREEHFESTSAWTSRWCQRTRMTTGNLQVDFKAAARLASATDSISMFVEIEGADLKYHFQSSWNTCPVP